MYVGLNSYPHSVEAQLRYKIGKFTQALMDGQLASLEQASHTAPGTASSTQADPGQLPAPAPKSQVFPKVGSLAEPETRSKLHRRRAPGPSCFESWPRKTRLTGSGPLHGDWVCHFVCRPVRHGPAWCKPWSGESPADGTPQHQTSNRAPLDEVRLRRAYSMRVCIYIYVHV